jgi:spermidine synthase
MLAMDLLNLNRDSGDLVYGTNIDDTYLEVRESQHYRWFHFGDNAIQSIIDVEQPENILLPIPQAMLSFLLWKTSKLSILNLGLGSGVFERYFQSNTKISLQTVEISPHVVDVAKNYFYLPKKLSIQIESAEVYLQQCHQKVDVILCDIFANNENPACLQDETFYQNLKHNCMNSSVVVLNLFAIDEQHMVTVIKLIKRFFSSIVLIDFENYKNVVLMVSQQTLPNKNTLLPKSNRNENAIGIDFKGVIERWHVIS